MSVPPNKVFVPRDTTRESQRAFELLREDMERMRAAINAAASGTAAANTTSSTVTNVTNVTGAARNVFIQDNDPGAFAEDILWVKTTTVSGVVTAVNLILRTP